MTNNIHARRSVRKSRGSKKHFSRPRKRLRELERIIEGRHGHVPPTDDADLYLAPVANCFRMIAAERGRAGSVEDFQHQFIFWCDEWAPETCQQQVIKIARDEATRRLKLVPDDALGSSLRLPYVERSSVKATTIGSYDVDRAARGRLTKARRQERDRMGAAARRLAAGATPRSQSLSRTKPWEAEGISRSTWDRRRKKQAAVSDENSSPHQTEVDENSSPHPLSVDGRRIFVTASDRPAPKAPGRPDVVLEGEIITGTDFDHILNHPAFISAVRYAQHLERERQR